MFCKRCNNEHDGTFGSGIFCSRSCANSRIKSEEIKRKTSDTIKQGVEEGRIKTGANKGSKHKVKRTKDHTEKIVESNKKRWDEKGRITEDQRKARIKANVYAYRARKKNAIPDDADLNLIKQIYESAPIGYEVDHIIPISKGGLHHQDNLQYLPEIDNKRKGAKLQFECDTVIKWQDVVK